MNSWATLHTGVWEEGAKAKIAAVVPGLVTATPGF